MLVLSTALVNQSSSTGSGFASFFILELSILLLFFLRNCILEFYLRSVVDAVGMPRFPAFKESIETLLLKPSLLTDSESLRSSSLRSSSMSLHSSYAIVFLFLKKVA